MLSDFDAALSSFDAVRPGSLRRKILEYIADQGGELSSESGLGLRRQICDALGERPTAVSQALIALRKAGLLEREMDLRRHRCQAIRLISHRAQAHPTAQDGRRDAGSSWDDVPGRPIEGRRLLAELEAAQRELNDAIQRAADA